MSSSKRFEEMQDDFNVLASDLKRTIEHASKAFGEDKKIQYRTAVRQLDDIQSLLPELEKESSAAPHPYRQIMKTQIKQFRTEFDRLNKEVGKLGLSTDRHQLLTPNNENYNRLGAFGGPGEGASGGASAAGSNRGRLFQINDTLERTTDSITRSHQLAAETDQIGTEVIEELGTQRESLIRTKERLMDTDDNLRTSRRILRTMYRRVITNKLILIVIIILELAILAGVVYFKFFKHKKT